MKKAAWSSASSSSTNSSRRNHKKPLLCEHQLPPVLKLIKNGVNAGKRFYGCSLWPNNGCKFFELEDDEAVLNDYEDRSLQSLLIEKRRLEEKIEKLKLKNCLLKEELMESRFEAKKYCLVKKLAITGLLMSWLFFAVYLIFMNNV